jgi:uncharacterized phiE125 gp8 family phage protein
MPRNLVAGPAAEPINLAEAKAQCGAYADQTDDDARISGLIATARAEAEAATWHSLVLQTWEMTLDAFPCKIELYGPVRSVVSITYVDHDGVTQTLPASDYTVDTKSSVCRIVPAYSLSWPSVRDHLNSVTIRYKAGFVVPFTAVAGTDVITAAGHTFSNGAAVQLSNSGGALPAGLSANTDYYVINVSGNTLKLSATDGGAAIDITGAGTGTHFIGVVPSGIRQAMLLMIEHWYRNRGATSDFQTYEIPYGAGMLLSDNSVKRFC